MDSIDTIIEKLNEDRKILLKGLEKDILDTGSTGIIPFNRIGVYMNNVSHISQDIWSIFNIFEGCFFNGENSQVEEMEIIKNIGIDEYRKVYKAECNVSSIQGLSYHSEVAFDAYRSLLNRFIDNVITLVRDGENREEAIKIVFDSEVQQAENLFRNRKFLTKDPRVRINELCEMATRERGDNEVAYWSRLFHAFEFNLRRIPGISKRSFRRINEKFFKDVLNIRSAIIERNRRQQQNSNQNQGLFNKSQIDSIKRILRNWGESLSSIYLNCVKSFLSTYADDTVEDPIKDFCLAMDNNIKNKTEMKDEEENEFKTKMENYLKNMDRGDLDIVEAVVKIDEVKQALNENSSFVRLGDFIIEQINIVKNPQITR